MATVASLAREIVGSTNTSEAYLQCVSWIANRYNEMVSRCRFRHLRQIGELSIPAKYTTGTVTVTRGSTSVTGASTAWTTGIGSGTQENWYIRISSAWYKISTIGGDTSITLASAFAEDDVSAGSYTAVQRFHSLVSDARWLGKFVFTRLRLDLGEPVSSEVLDAMAPGRVLVGSYPLCISQVSNDSNNYLRVEAYPYSSTSEILHYVYWKIPTALSITTTIPPQIDSYTLKEGALVDMYRYLMARAYHRNRIEEGNSWGNQAARQMTVWERKINEAAHTDQGADDVHFILQAVAPSYRTGDITTAHDYVYHNWSYPSS